MNLDYTAGTLDRTLVFAPGENHSQSIPFTVNQDSIAEMRETIKLHIPQTTSARYTATPFDITTVTIIDDDGKFIGLYIKLSQRKYLLKLLLHTVVCSLNGYFYCSAGVWI